MMCDVGSIVLIPHMLLSSRKHFREAALKWGRLFKAYAGLSGRRGRKTR